MNLFEKDVVLGLVSINFQLGEAWPKEWPSAYKHLKNGDFENAMIEFVAGKTHRETNNWIKQTPYRTIKALKMIANEVSERNQEAQDTINEQTKIIKQLRETIAEMTATNTNETAPGNNTQQPVIQQNR